MWLFVPCPSVAESVDLTSDSSSPIPEYEPFVTLSGNPTRRPFSWRGWKNRSWISRLSGTISRPSEAKTFADEWISSWEEYPASPTVPRAKGSAKTTNETSGARWPGFFARVGALPCSWRTSPPLFPEQWTEFSGTWPKWGTLRNGACFHANPWEPRTGGSECSFLPGMFPTPRVSASGSYDKSPGENSLARPTLDAIGRNWQTPRCADSTGKATPSEMKRNSPMLAAEAMNWPTSAGNLSAGADTTFRDRGRSKSNGMLPTAVVSFGHQGSHQNSGEDGQNNIGRRLNVLFVEKLMGFPRGWSSPTKIEQSDLKHWATQLARLLPQWLGEYFVDEHSEAS